MGWPYWATENQKWAAHFPPWARDVLVAVGDWRGLLQVRVEAACRS